MTIKELHELQGRSLEWKVAHAIDVISSFINRVGGVDKVYVSFSGGVDSLVVLHIARTFIDKSIRAVFCNTGMEWPEIVKFVKTFDDVDVIHPRKHVKEIFSEKGFPLVSKRVSSYIREVYGLNPGTKSYAKRMGDNRFYSIPKKWRFLLDKPYKVSEKCCHYLKKEPFRKYIKETGRKPIVGTMADESILRTLSYVANGGCNSFKEGKEQSSPLSVWTSADVWEYIRHNRLSYCPVYDELGDKRTGCVVCGYSIGKNKNQFGTLYKKYPKMYDWFMNLENNGVKYRQALKDVGAVLPDEQPMEQDLFDKI